MGVLDRLKQALDEHDVVGKIRNSGEKMAKTTIVIGRGVVATAKAVHQTGKKGIEVYDRFLAFKAKRSKAALERERVELKRTEIAHRTIKMHEERLRRLRGW